MFGAITAQDIYDQLAAAGHEVDKKKIHLFTPVRTLGKHTVKVKLHTDVSVELAFDVVSENPIEPVTPEEKPAAERTEKRSERTERRPRKE
jgi:large subunit ribosomal protein L9